MAFQHSFAFVSQFLQNI